MNSNELCMFVSKAVEATIEEKVTEFLHEHPEYYHDCVNSSGKISSLEITLSYQPESLSDIPDTRPCLFVRMGGTDNGVECNRYPHNKDVRYSARWIDGQRVIDLPVV